MTTTTRQRRQPVQERSRATVTRILDAAGAIVDNSGVEAATTRAIAERAGVSYPSLYRFFADREEILDRLVERHLTDLDAYVQAAERDHPPKSLEELITNELELHVAYFEAHPGALELWFGGRHSPAVAREVHRRSQVLADRSRKALITAKVIPADADPLIFVVLVELGDRILELAFRERRTADRAVIEHGHAALSAYIRQTL